MLKKYVLPGAIFILAMLIVKTAFATSPTVTTNTATGISSNAAILNGTANPNGNSTTCYFEYGHTSNYDLTTGNTNVGSGTTNVPVINVITGLNASNTYHFRIVATNSDGTSFGSDQIFATTGRARSNAGGGDIGGGGCFIATAVYGSRMAEEVIILKNFRDTILLPNSFGKRFVEFYYDVSPPIAEFIADYEGLRLIVRASLLPVIGLSWVALKIGPIFLISLLILLGIGSICILRYRSY